MRIFVLEGKVDLIKTFTLKIGEILPKNKNPGIFMTSKTATLLFDIFK